MPDLQQITSDLRGVPDQALQNEMQQPSGLAPSYLVLAEMQRRQLMRQASQKQQQQGDSSTVLQDVVKNMMANQPPPGIAPAGMAPKGQPPTPGQMPTPTTPQPPGRPPGMAQGGAWHFDDGGGVEDDDAPPSLIGGNEFAAKYGAPLAPLTARPPRPNLNPSASDIDGWVDTYSQKYGVDPDMARAIMAQESSGNHKAVGPWTPHGQAVGLFQVMPYTARGMGLDERIPEQNVEAGIRYYNEQLNKYGDPQLALAAYNAGPGAVDKYHGIPPYAQTQNYVPQVMARYNKLSSARLAQQQQQQQTPVAQPPAPPTPQAQASADADRAAAAPAPKEAEMNPAMRGPNFGQQPDSNSLSLGIPTQDLSAAASQGSADDQPVFTAHSPGRIHVMMDDQKRVIDDITKRLNGLPSPYGPENVEAVRKVIPTIYGVQPDYLDNLSRNADTRAATINQLQQQVLARYQNPSPWDFLSNLAAGMGASKSLNLAQAFGQGVGLATQQRNAQQQQALTDYDALEKMREGIYNNVESERGRFGSTLASYLEHQASMTEDNRKVLSGQLDRAQQEYDKLKKMLVPTNPLQAMVNRDDFEPDQIARSEQAFKQMHGGSQKALDEELNALSFLKKQGDPFVQGGPFGSAAEQVKSKYTEQAANALQSKPEAAPEPLNKNLIKSTYLTNRQFVDGRNYQGKYAQQIQAQVDNTPGMTYLGKDQAESLDNIEDSMRGFDSMEKAMLPNLPKDSNGHILQQYLTVPLNKITQLNPVLASWGSWRANAIAQLRAAAGSKGLRINEAEIKSAVENDIPMDGDTVGTAMRKLAIMRRTIQNQEDTIFHTRGREAPAPDLPAVFPNGQVGYVPAAYWSKYQKQGYKLLE